MPKFAAKRSRSIPFVRALFALIFIWLIIVNPALADQNRREPVKIVYCEYMPFFFKAGNGEPRGIFVDFWKLWSQKTSLPVEFAILPWEESIQAVRDGNADVNAAVFYTPQRDAYLDFSAPFFDVSSYIFHHTSVQPPQSVANLSAYKVGVVSGDFSAHYLQEKQSTVTFKTYLGHERLIVDAIAGKIDAFIMEAPVAKTYLAKHGGLKRIQMTDIPVYTQQFRAGVKEGDHELLAVTNAGLSEITREEIDTIVQSWSGEINAAPVRQPLKKVIIATSIDQRPFHFVDEKGQVVGMLIDLWRLWSQKTGVEVTFKSATWSESLNMVRDGTADIHAGCFYSKKRDDYLDYAAPLKDCDTHFFFHQSIFGLKNLEDLIGFKIGALKNDYAADFVRRELPGAFIAEYPSNQALFDAVGKGEVRVFVGDTPTALFYLSEKGLLHEYRHHPARPLYSNTYFAAVKDGHPALVAAVNDGFDRITAKERAAIERRWVGRSDLKTKDVLVLACAKGYPPFSMLNSEGNPSGMFIDFWRLWAKKIGKNVEFRAFDRSDIVNAVSMGKADIHCSLQGIDGRETILSLSQPFYQVPVHLFYRVGQKLTSIDDPGVQRVGAVRDSDTATWLAEQLPREKIEAFASEEEMILAASNKEISAFAGELPVMLTLLNQHGRAGEFKYLNPPLFTQKTFAGVSKENPDLVTEINAGFNAIPHATISEIESSWIADVNLRYYKPRSNRIALSAREKKWIGNQRNIRLGVHPDLPPFDFAHSDGTYLGMASDYVRILNERLGINIEVVPHLTWSDALSQARSEKRKIDVLSSAVRTDALKTHMLFSDAYISFPWVIITRKEAPLIGGLRDLYGIKTAVVRDSAIQARLSSEHGAIPLLVTESVVNSLEAVSLGKTDAYVGNLAAASYRMQENNFSDLKIAASTDYDREKMSFAVRSDWPELVSMINKGLASITAPEHDKIRQKWFSVRFEHGIDSGYIRNVAMYSSLAAVLLFTLVFFWNRQMRKAKVAAETANKAKSEFLASLSHEIRTPMNVIMGMTDITLRSNLGAGQKENLRTAKEAARHLLEIIDDILDLSKIEAGKIKLEHIAFDLQQLMQGIIKIYTTQARQKGLSMELKQSPTVPRYIKGDPVRLRQILVNLIGNAIKFTEKGSIRLEVSLRQVENTDKAAGKPSPDPQQFLLFFSVQDTGMGIPADKLDIIFDSFTQAGRASTLQYGGTGLGLAICKKFAALMNGSISVQSEAGIGSTFAFSAPFASCNAPRPELPLRTMQATTAEKEDETAPALSILLAEDSRTNAAVASAFLDEMGHSTVTAGNGQQAIQLLGRQHVDLVLMDVEMPEIDGIEATRRIRAGAAGRKNRDIAVIALTAHALEDVRQACLAAGMNDFLSKPIEFTELKATIDNYTRGHRAPASCQSNSSEVTSQGGNVVLDRQGALSRLGNDAALLKEIYRIFTEETPHTMDDLRLALAENDADKIFFSAHNLKGAAERIGALKCRDLAADLEKKAKTMRAAQLEPLADELCRELEITMKMLWNTYLK